jgi:hypothetical protein
MAYQGSPNGTFMMVSMSIITLPTKQNGDDSLINEKREHKS